MKKIKYSIGVLVYWCIGVLVYWCIGVLVYIAYTETQLNSIIKFVVLRTRIPKSRNNIAIAIGL
jgi:hypothetical protein